MRQIKFRAKKIDGPWVIGGGVWTFGKDTALFGEDNNHHPIVHLVDPETVGECIGQTDKNFKEIYEGDVLKFAKRGVTIMGYMVWEAPKFFIKQITKAEYESKIVRGYFFSLVFYDEDGKIFNWQELEIIGNIHDNPELIRGGNHEV